MRDDVSHICRAQRRVWKIWSLQFRDMRWLFGGFQRVRERFERRHSIFMLVREIQNAAVLRRTPGRLARISKETHRWFRAGQDELFGSLHELHDLLGKIGNAFDRDDACSPS